MRLHRLHLLLAAVLGALAFVIVPLHVAQSISVTPLAPKLRPTMYDSRRNGFESTQSGDLSNTLPFSDIIAFATSAGLPDVMAVISRTDDELNYMSIYGASWSNDGGRNWWPFTTLPSFGNLTAIGIARRTDAQQPIRFLMGSQGILYRTGDYGLQWAISISETQQQWPADCKMNLMLSATNAQGLYTDAICHTHGPFTTQSLLAPPTYDEVRNFYASNDGGVTWEVIFVLGKPLWNLIPSPSIPNRLYAAYGDLYIGIESDDNGRIWKNAYQSGKLKLIALDRMEPDTMYGIHITGSGDDAQERHIVSTDNGVSWQDWKSSPCLVDNYDDYSSYPLFSPLVSTGRNQVWLRCKGSREWYYSGDRGDTWQPMGAADAQFVTPDYGHPGHALMVNSAGLWRSAGGGEWQLLTADFSGPPPTYIYLPHIMH